MPYIYNNNDDVELYETDDELYYNTDGSYVGRVESDNFITDANGDRTLYIDSDNNVVGMDGTVKGFIDDDRYSDKDGNLKYHR